MRRAIAGVAVIVTIVFGVGCRTVAEVSGSWRSSRCGAARSDGRSNAAHAGREA